MPRVARIVVPGAAHHVTQRGNNRQDVFFVDEDRRAYLGLLKEKAELYGLEVLGYCLMTNHVHIVAVPSSEEALAKAIGRTHFAYTQYVNRLHGRSGHLWQNRFYSCMLDEPHLWRALSYVERNPVRARMVRLAWRHAWSSAAAHIGERDHSDLLDLAAWKKDWSPAKWKHELERPDDEALTEQLRRSTYTGRPLATDRLLARLETRIGRRLRPNPVGRPKGSKKATRRTKIGDCP
ncbi:MAG: transposase [Phycisphaerae bacterium]|nr:transposase [Phycisphaerae bacterium]